MLLHHVELGVRQRDVRVAALGHEADRLQAAGARDPDGRVRLLQRPRPDVDVAEVVVLALEVERAGLGPRLARSGRGPRGSARGRRSG